MVQGGLLYIYLKNNFGEQELILCIPPSKIDIFLNLYHTSLLGGHSGITKCYQTLKQRIYCPTYPIIQIVHNKLPHMSTVQGKQKV